MFPAEGFSRCLLLGVADAPAQSMVHPAGPAARTRSWGSEHRSANRHVPYVPLTFGVAATAASVAPEAALPTSPRPGTDPDRRRWPRPRHQQRRPAPSGLTGIRVPTAQGVTR